MRLTAALSSFLLLATSATSVKAFTPSHKSLCISTQLRAMADVPSSPKVLTASDVMAKRSAMTEGETEEVPKLFTETIYDDFQSALLKLEKRVKDGKGSLKLEDVQQFELETGRIVEEMNAYLKDPEGAKKKISAGYASSGGQSSVAPTSTTTSATPITPQTSSPPPVVATAPPPQAAVSPPQQLVTAPLSTQIGYGVTDTSNDEGPAYDGQGGFGLARGTKNTYVIPGMDEMSPEEYRAKLQESISARQAKRREEAIKSGVIGNRSSNGYLETLGGGSTQGENDFNSIKKEYRSDSVSAWMEALGRVEKEINSNNVELIDIDELAELEEVKAYMDRKATSKRSLDNVETNEEQQDQGHLTSQLEQSIQNRSDSVVDFASTLKEDKEVKELSRKSEWQTETTLSDLNNQRHSKTKSKAEAVPLREEQHWFVEKRQRPVPSSNRPEYATVEKFIGDASKQPKVSVFEQQMDRGWYNEKRVRPTPNSDPAVRTKISDRTGVQSDRKLSKAPDSQVLTDGVWYDEKRVRPAPNSDPAKRPKVSDRTGAQQNRQSFKATEKQTLSDGVWYNEKRVRPAPNSDPAERPMVSNRTGEHHNRQSSKASDTEPSIDEGIWYDEKRVRPIPKSDSPERPKVADRSGAELEVNKKATKSPNESQPELKKGWYNEKRVRPIPNTDLPERPKVLDRTGSELDTTPKGPLRNSFLRSLLSDAPPNRTKTRMQTRDEAGTDSSEINHWWKDKTHRPVNYTVSSNAKLNNTYENRPQPTKNYGDLKIEIDELDLEDHTAGGVNEDN